MIGRPILGIAALLAFACTHVTAQTVDDRWITERVVAGKFDELRKVKGESDKGSPVAMYWWGAFLDACVLDRCDPPGARALWMKSATAGNSRARLALMAGVRSIRELDDLMVKTGAPATPEEKLGYAAMLVALSSIEDSSAWDKARAILKELAASEPRMHVIFAIGALEGYGRYPDELRAMVEAGFSPASEQLRRWMLISQRGHYPELLAQARSGDLVVGVALCETVGLSEGYEVLPPELLPICERGMAAGYPGITPVLLRHHRARGNMKAAAFYAGLCATLPVWCASDLADFHYDRSGKSPAWEVWDIIAAMSLGLTPSEAGKPAAVMRQVFSITVRNTLAERACCARRFNASSKKFDDDPACPWRKPVAIPAEFLQGAGSK